jgi:hypothetical protein
MTKHKTIEPTLMMNHLLAMTFYLKKFIRRITSGSVRVAAYLPGVFGHFEGKYTPAYSAA